ncbi:lytic transglycosylase domain-containing protein [Streptomyces sp. ODS28]|uniref:aggregation-promoting factor C-terminal-like domain-containing protein n=1 Tax=Streptomyces sp. ODS28 TaxID=3136688 RepID=UPI0031ED18AF
MYAWLRNHSFALLSTLGPAAMVGALVMAAPDHQVTDRSRAPETTLRDARPVAAAVGHAPRTRMAAQRKAAQERAAQERESVPVRATRTAPRSAEPRDYAREALESDQFDCLDSLVDKESSWNVRARNPKTGAYGLLQALPPEKMSSAGSDWRTNGVTQLRWALEKYIPDRYETPCGAWSHARDKGWF